MQKIIVQLTSILSSPAKTKRWKVTFCLLSLALAVMTISSARSLYIDGAYYLLNLLQNESFAFFEPSRTFAHSVSQGLPLLLIKAGATNINTLVTAYGFSLHVIPIIAWSVAILVSRTNVHILIGLFGVVYLNAPFFHGEYILTYSLVVMLYSIVDAINHQRPLNPFIGAVALAAAIVSIRLYESMVFLSPLLLLQLLFKIRRSNSMTRWFLVTLIFLFFLAFVSSGYYI